MKSMQKRSLGLLLALALLLTAAFCGAPAAFAAQPEASASPSPEAEKQDIVILYTSDIHCGIAKGFGYAGLEQIRSYMIDQGNAVILVDNGDNIQGEAVGTMTKGEVPLELMNAMGYDVAIPGNHEFDYGTDTFLALTKQANFPYICCNFTCRGEPVFEPYLIRELGGRKVAFVGITTPTTLVSSNPDNFRDENGELVYGFTQDETGEAMYRCVQDAVDAARAEGAEYVIALAHLGNEQAASPWTYADVVTHTRGIDAFLDGHSHDTEQVLVKNLDGRQIPRSACGTKMACIGWCRIAADDGSVTAGIYTWNNSAAVPDLLRLDNDMTVEVRRAMSKLNEALLKVVATSQVELTINDPIEKDAEGEPIRMVRRAETNLGDLAADAFREEAGADIAVINGGALRDSIERGEITLGDLYSVFPFNNGLCMVEMTGQQILDALEWGARAVPGESGGFLQVSGLSYEVHSYIDTPCSADEESNCVIDAGGERRVKNVLVGGEPIDPAKTYTVAGNNYMLRSAGDGFCMFKDTKLLLDQVKLDNQTLIDYISDTLGGTIGEAYDDPTGQGRITIVETKP